MLPVVNDPRPFIVLAARRSGTTFLLSYLDSHPDVVCHKRAFDVVARLHWLRAEDPRSRYRAFRRGEPRGRMRGWFRPRESVARFVAQLCGESPDASAVGIRLSYEQAARYPRVLRWAAREGVPVIHLVRENALKTLVSRATSQARRLRHTRAEVETVRIAIPAAALPRRLRALSGEIERMRRKLAANRGLELHYERLIADPERETRRILDFLGIERRAPLKSPYRKINPESLAEVVENYAEVCEALAGTPWEGWLDATGPDLNDR